MSVIWNPGGLLLTDDNGVTTTLCDIADFTIEPCVSEYVAKSCFIEVESTEPWRFRNGRDMTPLFGERRTKVTFELENGGTLIVHLKPSPAPQTTISATLIMDDLVEQETEEIPVDLDGLL